MRPGKIRTDRNRLAKPKDGRINVAALQECVPKIVVEIGAIRLNRNRSLKEQVGLIELASPTMRRRQIIHHIGFVGAKL